jgi:hypothetical protein
MGETLNSSLICVASSECSDAVSVCVAAGWQRPRPDAKMRQLAVSTTQQAGHECRRKGKTLSPLGGAPLSTHMS